MRSYELRRSADGNFTLYSKEYDECYHSLKDGSLKESLYKHVEPAFTLLPKKELRILDICFGLGMNTLTTLYYFYHKEHSTQKIHIYSPELDRKLLKLLPTFIYPQELEPFKPILLELLQKRNFEDGRVSIELFVGDAREYIKRLEDIDIVYQDAFSPKKNPTLWTIEYFKDLFSIMNSDSLLTTYSIATPVRLALWEAGFMVYEKELEGMKKITIASKKKLPLQQIDMEEKAKRSSSSPLKDRDVQ